VIDDVAHLLPAQGPIGIFIHHNPLHALEDLPFEDAAVAASELLGTEPFMAEERYRAELARGRIRPSDLDAVVVEELGEAASETIAGLVTRGELRSSILTYGIPRGPHPQVEWLVRETDALERLREDLPDAARARLLAKAAASGGEPRALSALHDACLAIAHREDRSSRARISLPPGAARSVRHRDLLLAATGADTDELVHPILVRCCAAFLDQGLSYWPAPGRELGFLQWFARLHGPSIARSPEPFLRELESELRTDPESDLVSIERSLAALGVAEAEREPFLLATSLALRGWAGMMRQVEERPDRVPVHAPPATLSGLLAVRLLLDRAAASFVVRTHGVAKSLPELWAARDEIAPRPPLRHPSELAWQLFHVAQILGLAGDELERLDAEQARALVAELDAFGALARRRAFHLAYERRYRLTILDALAVHRAERPRAEAPELQAIFCIDEREESIRRHLEEVEPGCETLGAAGFFGVAMYHRGIGDAHARPLCPIAIVPEHEVEEVPIDPTADLAAARRASRRGLGKLSHGMTVGSRTFVRGTVISALLGAIAAIPLTLRVLFPRLTSRISRQSARLVGPTRRTRLALDRRDGVTPSLGKHSGFTKDEMAAIVATQLENLGMRSRFAPLVLIVGHGSSSLNNPHESAHDCGACGGGHGGANARAFAQMANDPAVRALVAARGVEIPESSWFVGAEHNSCDDAVEYFDADLVPKRLAGSFERLTAALDEARTRDAHERCRRFDNVPRWLPPELALAHVEGRSEDLAQPRPEYGHATNAVCVVGRRSRTRALFLDRRAFLTSYDPTIDDARGTILARILAAVVPVVAGINLEYWFGYVDPTGYGCGTKLPHNITGLLGIMDGHASDLRTGLPWQMLEIHEPVRLLIVVEAKPELLERVVAESPMLARTVQNRWIWLASLDPDAPLVHEHGGGAPRRHVRTSVLATVPRSEDWYRGERDHLPPAAVRAEHDLEHRWSLPP
jgi:uncharacterized protein YbcC (UPF0753/DUF2309 family)